MHPLKAMGAPGDWGYGTPIGDGLLAALQQSPIDTPFVCAGCRKGFVWVNKIPDPRCSCGGEIVIAKTGFLD
jgi:hypothetical protein